MPVMTGVPERVSRERFDQPGMRAPIDQARVRGEVAIEPLARIAHPDHRCAVGIGVRKRIDQHRLPHAEHGGCGADADGDRTDRDRRKPFLAPHEPKGQPEILREDLQVLSGCVRRH